MDRCEQKSAEPGQTAPKGAVWPGSTLFAIPSASFKCISALKSQCSIYRIQYLW